MVHDLYYSLIAYLEAEDDFTEVKWGKSEGDEVLPFATVEDLNTGVVVLDKFDAYTANRYNFQVGAHARSKGELARLQDKLSRLLVGKLPLFDTSGEAPVQTGNTARMALLNVMPLSADSTESLTAYNRCYFDVQFYEINKV